MSYNQVYEPSGHLLRPVDDEAPRRAARLRELGLGQAPDRELDAFARELAEAAQKLSGTDYAPFTMINFVTDHQYLGGLHTPPGVQVDREAPIDLGFCPHVVVRRKALVLDDVCDYPRFAGNPIVDKLGVRTYVGAPLIDRTGTALGTICVVDNEPRPWGHPGLNLIKESAAELVQRIHRREGLLD